MFLYTFGVLKIGDGGSVGCHDEVWRVMKVKRMSTKKVFNVSGGEVRRFSKKLG